MAKKTIEKKFGEHSKADVINALGLRRVNRLSDGKRVWLDLNGNEYASIAQAAAMLKPQKEGE